MYLFLLSKPKDVSLRVLWLYNACIGSYALSHLPNVLTTRSMSNTKSKQSDKDNRKTSDGEASGYFSDSNAQSHENNNESLTSGRTNTYNLQQQQRKRDTPNNNSNNNNSNESETAPRSRLLSTKSSLSRLAPSKSRSRAEPSTQNMTVETETVSSIPQTPITMNHQADRAGSGRTDYNGSIKLKPSNETIRPKRERKWTSRKPISVAAGNGMSYPLSMQCI